MKKLKLFFVAMMIAAMSGCTVGSDEITLLEVRNLDMASLSRAELTILVDNASRSNVKVLSGRLSVNIEDTDIAEIMLLEPAAVHRRSVEEIKLKFGLRVTNQLVMLSVMSNPDEITFSGSARFSTGLLPKKIEFRELPYSQISHIFGTLNQ